MRQNEFEKAIANLKEGEIILGARVAEGGTEIVINDKVDESIKGTVLTMMLHAFYTSGIKKAKEHDIPLEMAKVMAQLPIMMAVRAFKEVKDDEELLGYALKQVREQKEEEKAKVKVEAEPEPKEEKELQKGKKELAKNLDEVFHNLTPNEQNMLSQLIVSMARRAMEEEGEDE